MPELPEVEQVRISLLPHIVGKTIEKVRVDLPKMILHPDPDAFARRLQGARFTGVRRRGKYLGLELEGGDWLLVHLRMTGALVAANPAAGVLGVANQVYVAGDGAIGTQPNGTTVFRYEVV